MSVLQLHSSRIVIHGKKKKWNQLKIENKSIFRELCPFLAYKTDGIRIVDFQHEIDLDWDFYWRPTHRIKSDTFPIRRNNDPQMRGIHGIKINKKKREEIIAYSIRSHWIRRMLTKIEECIDAYKHMMRNWIQCERWMRACIFVELRCRHTIDCVSVVPIVSDVGCFSIFVV